VAHILVPFQGDGSGLEELTWGQRGLWTAMQATGTSLPLTAAQQLPAGATVDLVVAGLRFVLSRHQSLRTKLRFDGGGCPRQEVWSSGEVALEIVDADAADGGAAADPAEVAEQIRRRYQDTVFDYPNEWPVRMAVVGRAGVPSHVVVGYCHLALDAFGLDALIADLATMDPGTGRSAAPAAAVQPLELARRQREPVMLRQSEASLRYLERLLRSMPARRLGESADPQQPRYWEIGYTSPATLLAAQVVAARNRVGTGPVLLAAAAVALARLTGIDPTVLQVLVNNRFRPGFADAVTPLTQSGVCLVEVGTASFAEVIARAVRAFTRAAKNAYYDPVRSEELIAAVGRERGAAIELSVFFNDRRTQTGPPDAARVPTVAEVRAALPGSTLRWEKRLDRFDHALFIHIDDTPEAIDFFVCADTHRLSPADLEALVRGLEAVVVAAAIDPAPTTEASAAAAAAAASAAGAR
jgi:hypothetical protein